MPFQHHIQSTNKPRNMLSNRLVYLLRSVIPLLMLSSERDHRLQEVGLFSNVNQILAKTPGYTKTGRH
jgi:hypothetical protein